MASKKVKSWAYAVGSARSTALPDKCERCGSFGEQAIEAMIDGLMDERRSSAESVGAPFEWWAEYVSLRTTVFAGLSYHPLKIVNISH